MRLLASAIYKVKSLASVEWHSIKSPSWCASGGGCIQALAVATWCLEKRNARASDRSASTFNSFAAPTVVTAVTRKSIHRFQFTQGLLLIISLL